jgi:multicomponent Na+:H+ antiporter subunit E
MRTFLLNLTIALLWLLLSDSPNTVTFLVGFVAGMVLLALFAPVLPKERYHGRMLAVLRFGCVFLREFTLANWDLLRTVLLQSREDLHPNLLTLDVSGMTRAEILLLSHCISLTPGSVTVQIEPDFQWIVVHALHARDPAAVRERINATFRRAILEFTRG